MKKVAKFVTALIGAAAIAVTTFTVPDHWKPYAAVLIALATALGVYRVPNQP